MLESWILSSIILAGLVVMSAFFSGSETALIGSGRIKLNMLADNGSRGARRALKLLRDPGDLLATILVGNNLVNVMTAALATVLLGPVYATILVTFLLLIFAEITPKTLAAYQPEKYAVKVSGTVWAFRLVFKPVAFLASGIADLLLWPVLGGRQTREMRLSRQELLTAIRLGARDGELEPSETRMTREILALKDKPVRRIMIPIEEVDGISEAAGFNEVMQEFVETENTRYPVYRGELGEMIGLLLVKDLLAHLAGARENWRKYVRPLMRCRSDLEADELLRDMQIKRSHMAAVENELGEIIGIVTMEDVLEEIVGEIQDEYDDEGGELIREYNSGRYIVQGKVEVDDLCKMINVDLGYIDQHATLAQWFELRCRESCGPGRRLTVGTTRIRQRSAGLFEIRVRPGRTVERLN
jgi:putative hemolysin